MDKIINNICEVFDFGTCYPVVTIEKIEKLNLPVAFSGSDYKILNPKDTECGFNYFRLLNEEPVYTDIGGTAKVITKTKLTYKWVCFAKNEANIDNIILAFQKKMPEELMLNIKSTQKNPNKLIKDECGITFDIQLKKWTYFSIDFQITTKYDNCFKNKCV